MRMHCRCVLGGRWPVRLASQSRLAFTHLAARAAHTDDGLDRLEWFFGADDDAGVPYRWHQHQTSWAQGYEAPQPVENRPAAAEEAGAPFRAPGAAGAAVPAASQEQLSHLSVSQLSNLKAAADRAAAMMQQLQQQAAAHVQSVAAGVRTSEGHVRGQVAQLAQLTEVQLGNLREALLQLQTAVRSQQEQRGTVPQQQKASRLQQGRSGRDQLGTEPAAARPVAGRLRQEVQQGLALLQEMSAAQVSNLQLATQAAQAALSQQAQRVQATLQQAAVRAPAQQTSLVKAPRAAQKVARAASAAASEAPVVGWRLAVPGGLQDLTAAGVSNLPQAAARVQHSLAAAPGAVAELPSRLLPRVPSIALPSVAIPSIHLPAVSRAELSRSLADWAGALAAGAALLAAAALRWLLRRGSRQQAGGEQSLRARARSRRSLDRQKDRFRQALLPAEGSTDTSVFSAVSRKGANAVRPEAGAAASDEEDEEEEEEGEEDGGFGGPESWDDATRKGWEEFLRGSKLPGAAKMWDTGDVDEGLPKVYVDLEKE